MRRVQFHTIHIALAVILAAGIAIAGLSPRANVFASPIETAIFADETPTPTVHTVRSGETLSQIAFEYDVSVQQIAAANGLLDLDLIQIGRQLVIPVASPDATSTPAAAPPEQPPLLACPQNTAVHALNLPADPIRMAIAGNQIYLVADGDLFRMPIPGTNRSGAFTPVSVVPPDRLIGNYVIRELVYVTLDAETGDLLLLDKTNDIYRYTNASRTSGNEWQFESLASQVPGQFPDPQFLAVQPTDGHVYALDADLQHIWQTTEAVPRTYLPNSALDDALDMAIEPTTSGPPRFHVLTRSGAVLPLQVGRAARALEAFPPRAGAWPAQIMLIENNLYVVDAEERTVRRHSLPVDDALEIVEFRLPDMGLLRSIDLSRDTLYAVAGDSLYSVAIEDLGSFVCPPLLLDSALSVSEISLLKTMAGIELPFENATLPKRLRSYPGARRLYRQGIHRGVDLYATEAEGLHIGSPVSTIADGVVVRIDDDYREMTPVEYEAAVSRTEDEHRTPPDLMERFQGRQVRVDHGNDIQSWYSHLASTAPGLKVGDVVAQGDVIGTVGVSGTSSGAYGSSGGAHLHFEIWIGDTYLGHGLSLYETMRIWQEIFSPSGSRPETSAPTVTPTASRTNAGRMPVQSGTATPTPTSLPPTRVH